MYNSVPIVPQSVKEGAGIAGVPGGRTDTAYQDDPKKCKVVT